MFLKKKRIINVSIIQMSIPQCCYLIVSFSDISESYNNKR